MISPLNVFYAFLMSTHNLHFYGVLINLSGRFFQIAFHIVKEDSVLHVFFVSSLSINEHIASIALFIMNELSMFNFWHPFEGQLKTTC